MSVSSGFLEIGDDRVVYAVSRSKKRKRTLAFKFERDGSLRVMAPASVSLAAIEKILLNRASWIQRERSFFKQKVSDEACVDGSAFYYLGHLLVLKITQGLHLPPSCWLTPHVLHVHVPDKTLSPDGIKKEAQLEISLWIKKRARAKFKKRLDFWAGKLDVRYNRFVLSDPERRWGSCSADNTIRLNWRLIKAPLGILDYVVVHELAHVVHKNHSAHFWGFIAGQMPDYALRRKALRQFERYLT